MGKPSKKKREAKKKQLQQSAAKWHRKVESIQEDREQQKAKESDVEAVDEGNNAACASAGGQPSAQPSGATVAGSGKARRPTKTTADGKREGRKSETSEGDDDGLAASEPTEGELSGGSGWPPEQISTTNQGTPSKEAKSVVRLLHRETTLVQPESLGVSTASPVHTQKLSHAATKEKLIRDATSALSGTTKRTSGDILTSFLHKDSPLRLIFCHDYFDSQPASFYEQLLSALEGSLVQCFTNRSMESVALIRMFIHSSTFTNGLCRMQVLKALDPAILLKFVTILLIATQELPDQNENFLHITESMRSIVNSRHAQNPRLLKETARLSQQLRCDREFQATLKDHLRLRSACNGIGIFGPVDYRAMNILPSDEELKLGRQPELPVNNVEDRYSSTREYVETHFRLLREDFVAPLRSSVQEFMARSARGERFSRLNDGGLYSNVTVLPNFEGVKFDFKMDLKGSALEKWETSKKLPYGSLVLLSLDQFWTITHATVEGKSRNERGAALLKLNIIRGHAQVLRAIKSSTSESGQFVMIESTSYYESYRYNASILQQIDLDSLPFQEYLVNCCKEPCLPDYLWYKADSGACMAGYDFTPILKSKDSNHPFRNVSMQQTSKWPQASSLGLDDSQADALKMALTQKLAIIQGPPGTGKTFIGIKIVDMLLANDKAWRRHTGRPRRSPHSARSSTLNSSTVEGQNVMVVCYTNHALDQFLESIMRRHPNKVVRVGSQSNNAALAQYNLKDLMKSHKLQRDKDYYQVRNKISSVEKSLVEKSKSATREANWSEVSKVLGFELAKQIKSEAEWKEWINCSDMSESRTSKITSAADAEELEDKNRSSPNNTMIAAAALDSADPGVLHDIEGTQSATSDGEVKDFNSSPTGIIYAGDAEIHAARTEISVGQADANDWQPAKGSNKAAIGDLKTARLSPLKMTPEEVAEVENMWTLDAADRCRMHKYVFSIILEHRKRELEVLNKQITALKDRLHEMRMREMLPVFKDRPIVGMTITGAAKYSILMRLLKPRIVIIEEAAEVLEAHVLTSITDSCQHLILIGDHKQLRPNPAVYELACNYNLDVSLFERMVKHHSLPFACLKVQHRMRPEISKIMTPIFYEELYDHPCVQGRSDVRGIIKNVFFLSHTQKELGDDCDSRSHVNIHEAALVQSLCGYLLKQAYDPSQITVLVAYTGQLFECRRLLQSEGFGAIRITTVDNYQGEENDIIILSLVRSSENGSIGFLKTDNRVCVALSRARMGFYCLGNFDLLSKKSDKWSSIAALLVVTEEIGPGLPLGCHKHTDQRYYVSKAEDFLHVPPHGCGSECGERLACGHTCQDLCHPDDPSHAGAHQCRRLCSKPCPKGHRSCPRLCRQPCEPCTVGVPHHFEACGHTWPVPCYLPDEEKYCANPVDYVLPCGHEAQYPCHQCSCTSTSCCKEGWVVAKSSGKQQKGVCRKIRFAPCLEPNLKTYDGCGHQIKVSCHALNCPEVRTDHCLVSISILVEGQSERSVYCRDFKRVSCPVIVEKDLVCGHSTKFVCSAPQDTDLCPVICKQKRPQCGHEVEKACSASFDSLPRCTFFVDKQLPCSHHKSVMCGSPDMNCIESIELSLPCGHLKTTLCGLRDIRCTRPVEKPLPCGHNATVKCCESKLVGMPQCTKLVETPRPGCSHMEWKRCCDNFDVRKPCLNLVDKQLPCGHEAKVECHAKNSPTKCNLTIKTGLPCGHSTEKKCYEDATSVKCRQLVVVELECKHTQTLPCFKRIETEPCKVSTKVILPGCGHEFTKICSEDLAGVTCKQVTSKRLPCGHNEKGNCGVDPHTIRCESIVDKLLPCRHTVPVRCFEDIGSITCDSEVEEHLPCGHDITYRCAKRPLQCMKEVSKSLPCGHQVELPCSVDISSYCCRQLATRNLQCGHPVLLPCSDDISTYTCMQLVNRRQECGHNTALPCSSDVNSYCCLQPVIRALMCGHWVEMPCGHDVSKYLCTQPVERALSCGHQTVAIPCYSDIRNYLCMQLVSRKLVCGHETRASCHLNRCSIPWCSIPVQLEFENGEALRGTCEVLRAAQCPVIVQRKLNCGHNVQHRCCDAEISACSERVDQKLPCGHKAKSYCHLVSCTRPGCTTQVGKAGPCNQLKRFLSLCSSRVEQPLPCRHKIEVPCHVSTCSDAQCPHRVAHQGKSTICKELKKLLDSHVCEVPVTVALPCKHDKELPCYLQSKSRCNCDKSLNSGGRTTKERSACQLHSCDQTCQKSLTCGHTVVVPCRERDLPVVCAAKVDFLVPTCLHSVEVACSSTTNSDDSRGQDQLRKHPTSRDMPACDKDSCASWCVHGGCVCPCSEPCQPCMQACTSGCRHRGKCQRPCCFQACDVPPCDKQCERVLSCGHPCLGLCGEECPEVCGLCSGDRILLRRICSRYKSAATSTLLSLKPCGHVVPVDYMDAIVKEYDKSIRLDSGRSFWVRPLTCPECRHPVGGCRRYDDVLKRYYNYKRKLPGQATGEWLGCSKGHVRPADEANCGECQKSQSQPNITPGDDVIVTWGRRKGAFGKVCDIMSDEAIVIIDCKAILITLANLRLHETGIPTQQSGKKGSLLPSTSAHYEAGHSLTFHKSEGRSNVNGRGK